ncbi:elongin-A [Ziziphus jujuba]|uniref:Elongin-A n=1 Tax=Ziziphus jujuba TaxID=326968 RepID=A0A6P6G4H5_ZIZJJ|nr:elongin-A [Ziziphus jujuba]XP_048328029.2 elongin-A [Ziziphus jujuba]XP_048328030.2 elongin-A [Ziziphus jujuba]XP_048328031.2 elongin-A [Ziziphus jujuba]
MIGRKIVMEQKAPSLVDLCVRTAIDNIRYLGDVGETDIYLLDKILPHCTLDQLMHVEKCSEGRDLSPITDKLWKKFYEKDFGVESTNLVVKRMNTKGVFFKWKQLYEAKLKDVANAEKKAVDRIMQLYKKEDARKQSRQVQFCSKVPPSSNKRSFFGGSGPGYNVSNLKSNLMKKSRIEFLKSNEVKNLAAMKRNSLQRNHSASLMKKPVTVSGKDLASTSSKHTKPAVRRF